MRSRILLTGLLIVVAACADGTSATTSSATPTTTPPAVTTTTVAPPTTTTAAPSTTAQPPGLAIADEPWVVQTLAGLIDATDEVLFETSVQLGAANVVRDHLGGVIFTDAFGLSWWRAGASEPNLVLQGDFQRLIEAIPTAAGPVVRIAGAPDRYLDLTNLSEVAQIEGAVEITDDFEELWHAANGLTAMVTSPEVTLTFEGFPDDVIEPPHLVITRGDETLLDLRIGGPVDAFARIHDFDGQHVIVSRAPYEPAIAPETYVVFDLGCPECTKAFVATGASATLTGADADWDGPVTEPNGICSAWDPTYEPAEADARYPVAVESARRTLLRVAAACDFTGLLYQFDVANIQIVLSHAAIANAADPGNWLDEAPGVLADVAAALRLPGRTAEIDGETVHVFPAWYAVDAWDELTQPEQAAMELWYGDGAAGFWTDYPSIGHPEDLSVTLSEQGKVIGLIRPLS